VPNQPLEAIPEAHRHSSLEPTRDGCSSAVAAKGSFVKIGGFVALHLPKDNGGFDAHDSHLKQGRDFHNCS